MARQLGVTLLPHYVCAHAQHRLKLRRQRHLDWGQLLPRGLAGQVAKCGCGVQKPQGRAAVGSPAAAALKTNTFISSVSQSE